MIIEKKGKNVVIDTPCKGLYRVTFVIDMDANTPKEAALLTEKCLKKLSYRPSLQVIDSDGNVNEFDLADERKNGKKKSGK